MRTSATSADRPYGSFRKDGIIPPPPAAPAPPSSFRERLRRFQRGTRELQLVAAGAVAALVASTAFVIVNTPPRPLTEADVQQVVTRALASATPKPGPAITVFEKVRPSVVQVKSRPRGSAGGLRVSGAGIVLDSEGHILTTLDVVRDAAEIAVVFFNGTETAARVLDSEEDTDAAILETAPPGMPLTPAVLMSSAKLRPGEEAFVIGSPFGLKDSLSAGVISGLDRTFRPPLLAHPLSGLIQFDAAASPGSFGGPLVDRNGNVVGIVAAVVDPTGQGSFAGIGFAIPIDVAANASGAFPF